MGDVYGGASNAGRANGNLVELAGGTVTGNVVGGEGGAGATGNTISLDPGAEGKATTFGENSYLIGGTRADGSENKLTIVGVKDVKVAGVDGFQRYKFKLVPGTKAGDTLLTATKAVTFCNSTFKVDFSDSSIFDFGWSKDNHKINLITLENGNTFHGTRSLPADTYTFNGILSNYTGKLNADTKNVYVDLEETPLAGDVKVVGKHKTAATGNTVVVPDGTTDPNAIAALAASKDDTTALTENSVTVETGGTVEGRAVGADSYAGDVRKNTVTVKANGTVKGFVAGGLTATGTADSNTVTLDGVKIGKIGEDGSVTGGNAYGGYSAQGTAEKNTLTMDGSAVYNDAYGGYAPKGAATGNTLEMKNESSVGTDEYGGNAYGGYGTSAESNELTVQGSSTVGNAYGGRATTGMASKNKLTVTKSGKVTGDAYGSYAAAGKADGTLSVQNGTVNGDAYGAYALAGDASGKLTLSSGGKVSGNAYGSYSATGAATDSTLTMSDGASANRAYGGYGKTSASKNSVTITGGTVKDEVFGGSGETSATDNSVTISGGEVDGEIYGGRSGTSSADRNTVTVTGGTVQKDVYGGSGKTSANGNKITLAGGTVRGYVVYGGYTTGTNTTATGNTITLQKGADGNPTTFGESSRLYGGYGTNTSGNTLIFDGVKNVSLKGKNSVNNFNTYVFDIADDFGKDDAVLKLSNDTNFGSAVVVVQNAKVGEKIWLVAPTFGIAITSDNVKLGTNENAAKTATVKTDGTLGQEEGGLGLFVEVKNVKYTFDLTNATAADGALLTSASKGTTTINSADVTLQADNDKLFPFGKGDTISLLTKENGKVAYTGSDAAAAPKLDHTYKNGAGTATVETTGHVTTSSDGKSLVLDIDKADYTFDLDAKTANGDTFIDSKNTNDTKIDGTDLTLNKTATKSDILSLSKGDTLYLLKKAGGKLTYDGTGAPALDHTYTNGDGNATIHTTGAIGTKDNNLVLDVGKADYTFDLDAKTANGYTCIDSDKTNDTTVGAADLTLNLDADGKILSLSKGDTVYLLKKAGGTLTYTGEKTLTHDYANDAGDATIATKATVAADGSDLVLKVGEQKYTFTLTPGTTNEYTFLDSTNDANTTIDAADVTINDDTTKQLSLNKGDTIYLLKKDAGTLTYKGEKTLDRTYTNAAKDATIETTGTVAAEGNNLVLNHLRHEDGRHAAPDLPEYRNNENRRRRRDAHGGRPPRFQQRQPGQAAANRRPARV